MNKTDPEWELLPPETSSEGSPLTRWLALLLDELIRIPGTRFRVGLDPIIGLIPGVGDAGTSLLSALAIVEGARKGLPKIVLARMALNILINQVVGMLPLVGDAFSFWFKSNSRNYRILTEHGAKPRPARKSDWVFVFVILALIAAILLAGLALTLWILSALSRALFGS